MHLKPFENHPQSTTWHFTFYNSVLNTYNDFVISIPGMEMSRGMV